jgi:hypothetical protein
MSGDDDVVVGEIETPISEEDTTSGSGGGGQFVGSLCGEVEIENAIEHTQGAHMRVRYRRG